MRESPFEIVALGPERAAECAEILRKASAVEFSDDLPKADYNKVTQVLANCATNKCLIGYLNNGNICGFMALELTVFWWSTEEVLSDVMLYIKPEFRSYSAFNRLLSVAEEFARINNVPIALSFFTDKDLAKKAKAIMRRGYKAVSWMMFRRNTTNGKQKTDINNHSKRT